MSVSFPTHARTIAKDLSQLTRDLLGEFHRLSHEFAYDAAVAKTPVDSGEMRSKWRNLPSNIQSAIDRLKPTKVENTAPHALIIDMGRRRSKNAWKVRRGKGSYTVLPGKMLGSEQAPRGVKGPVLRELAAQEDAIFDRARARVEKKGPR